MRTAPWLTMLLCHGAMHAQTPTQVPSPRTGLLGASLTVDRHEHRYAVWVPPGYDPAVKWPLLVFLNGKGECGTDGWKQTSVGLGPAILGAAERWPFVVLFPQKPDADSAWEDHEAMVLAMVDRTRADYAIDDQRTFLTGLSQGGHGTWVLGARHPERWAAIAPVCGYGEPAAVAKSLAHMPIWCFHGDDDRAVPVQQSKDLCAAVLAAGGAVELTLYPKVGHDSWNKAYAEPLADWLLAGKDRDFVLLAARPERWTRAVVELRVDRPTDSEPPFRGSTTARLAFAGDALEWRTATTADDRDQPPRHGRMTAPAARQFVAEQLRTWFAAGVFRLPGTAPTQAPEGAPAEHVWRVHVLLEDGQRTLDWARAVPSAALRAAPSERARAAIDASLHAVATLR